MTEELQTFEERWAVRRKKMDEEVLRLRALRSEAWKNKRLVARQFCVCGWRVAKSVVFGLFLVSPAVIFWGNVAAHDFSLTSLLVSAMSRDMFPGDDVATREIASHTARLLWDLWAITGLFTSMIYAHFAFKAPLPIAKSVLVQFEYERCRRA